VLDGSNVGHPSLLKHIIDKREGDFFMNFGWLRFVFNVLTNESVLEPIIAILIGYGINAYAKNRKYKITMDITSDIVDYIEEHYKEWDIKGSEKMDKFLDLFSKEFKKQIGKIPKEAELDTARMRAEAIVQRARRSDRK
jgi:hypothetical protein